MTGFTTADLTVGHGDRVRAIRAAAMAASPYGPQRSHRQRAPRLPATPSHWTTPASGLGEAMPGRSTTNSNNYAIDNVRPTASIVVADNSLTIGETSLVTVTFSEAVTGFTTADLDGGSRHRVGPESSSDGGIRLDRDAHHRQRAPRQPATPSRWTTPASRTWQAMQARVRPTPTIMPLTMCARRRVSSSRTTR